ncbi:type II CRISPR RNA-guided endonuclease Cas9 [Carboxylicivirga sediminis]|uniref:CRISPR-associated endonuclease Cas9 n=1 Tax=Carboxylicivirga sediminis TaxID=2006564 RepID=A0A941IWS7_9BACT|nr:type II CRISPR RNA-guided endonuclease Cas9 [Carboxylicivirga sediminis]MBR8535470.1 type II CRISPR RNA-guided endonuclease Cas9 [Carboxylicivirga sediminis]
MSKILGLDLGTNSIGWAVVETEDNITFQPVDKGVRIFQEGVKIEKGVESSKAAERTGYRSARRIKYRRKLRKINTLKLLSEFNYCPKLTTEELDAWRYKKIYPSNMAFRHWWMTDNDTDVDTRKAQTKNPYYYRHQAATQKLDLTQEENRHALGRAFYHMAQRRGFLSNRLETTKENENGAVITGINEINEVKGNKTLGQYFYELYTKGAKIRDHYTHREAHYLDEFIHICNLQQLPDDEVTALKNAIFYQRPLKSQKGLIGKCPFETNKPRCAVSHPLFEEYRMLCFLNNIKIKTPADEKLRPLNESEREKISHLFYRKSKEHFDFEDIAKQLAPKKQYKYYKSKDKNPEDWLFNYSMKTTVSGCPVSARFQSFFGDNWQNLSIEHTRATDNQTSNIDINDVWHVLMTFDSDEKLIEFATNKLHLNEEQTREFIKIHLKQDFASLSLKAIKKVLPYLRQGLIYSHAIFLANMEEVIPTEIWANAENKAIIRHTINDIIKTQNEEKQITDIVNGIIKLNHEEDATWSKEAANIYKTSMLNRIKAYYGINRFNTFTDDKQQRIEAKAFDLLEKQMQLNMGRGKFAQVQRIDDRIIQFLKDNFGSVNADKLYHPSALETYKPAIKGDDGKYYLGSPITSSVRNPMAMRALHQLRKVINELIKNDTIDSNTTIHIEMARDLMNANERKALQSWQRKRENDRKRYIAEIKEHFSNNGISTEPTEGEVLKYQLWEEQKHVCIYTGQSIGLNDFLGANPKYDIEHTIPQSLSFDNSQVNLTLCDNQFNRAVKRNKIPTELPNHEVFIERIEHWKDEYEALDKKIQKEVKNARGAGTKESKDNAIRRRHEFSLERDYWREKYQRFTMRDVPSGFKNSQLVDIGIITKYSRLYLQTLFGKVFTVKGTTVADFRKTWGLQDIYEKKARVNHVHHCIDAITIACMTKANYDKLAKFYHDWEGLREDGHTHKPHFDKPWPTFTEDVKQIEDELFVSHYTPDNLAKKNKKQLRKRGVIQRDAKGYPIIQTGDSVRGSLHKDTFYGAIKQKIENKKGETEEVTRFVVRKKVADLTDADLKNVVDDKVRHILTEARKAEKPLLKEIEKLRKQYQKAEEHEEPTIKSEIAALEQQCKELYAMPNKNGAPIPINKVRLLQPSVTNPLEIKAQRDKSTKAARPHKEKYYAANDGNYLMAIYEGLDAKGKTKRDFELINNLTAARYYKQSVKAELRPQGITMNEGLIPKTKPNGKLELKHKANIKTGTMVILWENTPDEVWDLDNEQIKRRLYKVAGLSNQRIKRPSGKIDEYATIVLRFHQEASPASELKTIDGEYKRDEKYKGQRKLNHNQFNALIENIDFTISPLGKIEAIN